MRVKTRNSFFPLSSNWIKKNEIEKNCSINKNEFLSIFPLPPSLSFLSLTLLSLTSLSLSLSLPPLSLSLSFFLSSHSFFSFSFILTLSFSPTLSSFLSICHLYFSVSLLHSHTQSLDPDIVAEVHLENLESSMRVQHF